MRRSRIDSGVLATRGLMKMFPVNTCTTVLFYLQPAMGDHLS